MMLIATPSATVSVVAQARPGDRSIAVAAIRPGAPMVDATCAAKAVIGAISAYPSRIIPSISSGPLASTSVPLTSSSTRPPATRLARPAAATAQRTASGPPPVSSTGRSAATGPTRNTLLAGSPAASRPAATQAAAATGMAYTGGSKPTWTWKDDVRNGGSLLTATRPKSSPAGAPT